MSTAEIRSLLHKLDGGPADALESETLECKPWDPHPAARDSQLRELRETVVCLANRRGGVIVLGIADRKRTREDAIQGVPEGIDVGELRKRIYDGTEPHVLVDVEDLVEPEGRLLLIRVPKGLPPHTTAEGVGKIRVGKECKPLTGTELARLALAGGRTDATAEPATGASVADLDPDAIRVLQRRLAGEAGKPDLARQPVEELLANLGLAHDGQLAMAAILLLGRRAAITRWVPQHEVVFLRFKTRTRYDVRQDMRGPLLAVLEALERLFAAHLKVTTAETAGFAELEVPDLTWWAAREAVLNALVHREYFVRQSVQIEVHSDRVVVASPGGFVGGVTPENVLRHPPVRRNPLLADVLQTIGLVNRAGLGVDRIFEELLRLGKAPPRYEADEAHVGLTLPTRTHVPFARFVAGEATAGRALDLDDLLLLRALTDVGSLDRWSAAATLQGPEEEAAERLVTLRERGYLTPEGRGRGTSYRLAHRLSDRLRGTVATTEVPLDAEAVALRIQAVLAERGRLTNAEMRRISGYSRAEVLRLVRSLQEEGLVELAGRGRAAHYRPSLKLLARSEPGRRKGARRSPRVAGRPRPAGPRRT
jgi:ATP-dependent DNA helicase RecG